MEKIILTDADGVLLKWNEAFEKFMATRGFPRNPGTENDYSIAVRFKGADDVMAHELVREFNESALVAELEPFADSVTYVKKLADKGFRFTVVTSISDAPAAAVYRTQNLKAIFGDVFDEIICIKMGASKAATLQRWLGKGYFWIEDHMRQAEAGYEAGLRTVLISHPYNAHYKTDLFPTVSYETPWKEIYELVCHKYELEI